MQLNHDKCCQFFKIISLGLKKTIERAEYKKKSKIPEIVILNRFLEEKHNF